VRITKRQLRRIINEEMKRLLEGDPDSDADDAAELRDMADDLEDEDERWDELSNAKQTVLNSAIMQLEDSKPWEWDEDNWELIRKLVANSGVTVDIFKDVLQNYLKGIFDKDFEGLYLE